jgi:large subunit ribosomal protein L17
MRHGNKKNNLSRTAAHRKALLMNLGCQLITHKRITTTLAKAKALRTYIEPLITKTKYADSKETIMHNHRLVFSHLNDKAAVKELFTVVAPKVAGRPGGYTRIIKLGARVGDNAELAMIELVDFNEIYGKGISAETTAEPVKKTRRSGGAKKKATAKGDDLKLIEGVGPKAAEVLKAAGLETFADVAAATPEKLKEILDASGGSFNAADTTTWPEQAQLAADGKLDELKDLQEKLKGGREA